MEGAARNAVSFPTPRSRTLPESRPDLALNARCTPLSSARLCCSGQVCRRGSSGLGPSRQHGSRAERRGWDGLPPASVRVQLPLCSRSRMHLGPSLPCSRVCPCVCSVRASLPLSLPASILDCPLPLSAPQPAFHGLLPLTGRFSAKSPGTLASSVSRSLGRPSTRLS